MRGQIEIWPGKVPLCSSPTCRSSPRAGFSIARPSIGPAFLAGSIETRGRLAPPRLPFSNTAPTNIWQRDRGRSPAPLSGRGSLSKASYVEDDEVVCFHWDGDRKNRAIRRVKNRVCARKPFYRRMRRQASSRARPVIPTRGCSVRRAYTPHTMTHDPITIPATTGIAPTGRRRPSPRSAGRRLFSPPLSRICTKDPKKPPAGSRRLIR